MSANNMNKPKLMDPSRRLDGFTASYANHVSLEFTKLDLSLVFATLVKTESEAEIHIRADEYGCVRMALPQAKILALSLALNIANLEEQDADVGPAIRIPRGTLANNIPDELADKPIVDILEYIAKSRKRP